MGTTRARAARVHVYHFFLRNIVHVYQVPSDGARERGRTIPYGAILLLADTFVKLLHSENLLIAFVLKFLRKCMCLNWSARRSAPFSLYFFT